jgi:16S rRNA (cytosine1402-N4)-methyltransferase
MENANNSGGNQESTDDANYHVPVLLKETIEALMIKPGGTYVDCTFGGGGHSREMLKEIGEQGRLIAFDQDAAAQANLPADDRITFVPHNFRHLQKFLRLHKATPVDGILADLGVSSHQFDEADRGFSTRFDADLDMRMDNRQPLTAAIILNTYTEQQLHKLFEQYGEVTNAKTLAKTIIGQRVTKPFGRIADFKAALHGIVKGNPNKYFAQVFQALRIVVNDEMGALTEMLQQSAGVLKPGGRLVVISFHSLEDRLVKNFMKYGEAGIPEADDVYGVRPKSPFEIVYKKPVTATAEEMKLNGRARSAKLRAAEKI